MAAPAQIQYGFRASKDSCTDDMPIFVGVGVRANMARIAKVTQGNLADSLWVIRVVYEYIVRFDV